MINMHTGSFLITRWLNYVGVLLFCSVGSWNILNNVLRTDFSCYSGKNPICVLIKKVYNNPQKADLISKKFPCGRKYAILGQYCNVLTFSMLTFYIKMLTLQCVTNDAILTFT